MNKALENMVAIWSEPVPVIMYIGDTVEVYFEIHEREVEDVEEKQIFLNKKGIILQGSASHNCLFRWFTNGKMEGMAFGSPTPYNTRMVLTEKNIYRKDEHGNNT